MPPPPPDSEPDFIPLAFRAVGFSVLLGTAIMSGFLVANRLLVRDMPANATPSLDQPAALMLIFGVLLTMTIPAVAAWTILAPLGSAYRRGGLAMVSALGALLVSLASVPVNEMLGLRGLAGFLLLALLGAIVMWRRVARWSPTP